jgi:hypothetical protein
MEGIKGWVAVGLAIRNRAEENEFKFESTSVHGTFQISYDGYRDGKPTFTVMKIIYELPSKGQI